MHIDLINVSICTFTLPLVTSGLVFVLMQTLANEHTHTHTHAGYRLFIHAAEPRTSSSVMFPSFPVCKAEDVKLSSFKSVTCHDVCCVSADITVSS